MEGEGGKGRERGRGEGESTTHKNIEINTTLVKTCAIVRLGMCPGHTRYCVTLGSYIWIHY